jgi:hypothetical protein
MWEECFQFDSNKHSMTKEQFASDIPRTLQLNCKRKNRLFEWSLPYLYRKNSLELIELSSINKVSLV